MLSFFFDMAICRVYIRPVDVNCSWLKGSLFGRDVSVSWLREDNCTQKALFVNFVATFPMERG